MPVLTLLMSTLPVMFPAVEVVAVASIVDAQALDPHARPKVGCPVDQAEVGHLVGGCQVEVLRHVQVGDGQVSPVQESDVSPATRTRDTRNRR